MRRAAGVALIGGETAELPGLYRDGELDVAGTCVGIVERAALIDGSAVAAGDAVIGFASAGVHANGFTLVRRMLTLEDYDGPDLLAPTRLYLDEVAALGGRAKALAHVTGGGIAANLARVVPAELRPEIDQGRMATLSPVFAWLARHVAEDELFATRFQPRDRVVRGRRTRRARRHGDRTDRLIGVLVSGEGTNLQALLDAGLPLAAVASNRRDAYALVRARAAGLPVASFSLGCHADREERDLVMATWLEEHGVEVVVLAGYMHLLTAPFLRRFPGRVLNVHPSLLPAFPGIRAI